jgi:predicted CoA-binding protein
MCDLPLSNASDAEIARILASARTIAVVGLSDKPDRESHKVARYLQVDVVDIFRKPEFIPAVVNGAIARGARVVWMQLGLAHNAAAEKARAAGLAVVMDRCMKIEHARWSARRAAQV